MSKYNPSQLGINSEFHYKIVKPTLVRNRGSFCENCKQYKKYGSLDVHHEDYDNPNINTLKLLCRKCHRHAHIKKK